MIPMVYDNTAKLTGPQMERVLEYTGIPKSWSKILSFNRADDPKQGEAFKLIEKFFYGGDEGKLEAKRILAKKVADAVVSGRLRILPGELNRNRDLYLKNKDVVKMIEEAGVDLEAIKNGRPMESGQDEPNNDSSQIEESEIQTEIRDNLGKSLPKEELELPDEQKFIEALKEIKKELWIDEGVIRQIITNLCAGRHILLAGPIGTGKSALAKKIPETFWNYETKLVTATYEWGATEVVGGYKPSQKDGKDFEMEDGCVTETVKESIKLKKENTGTPGKWLIIDEFNRADIDKAMGQLFSSLVTGIIDFDGKEIQIPKDYRIIGTLNTSDKHYLNKLSSALLRRFAYIEVNYPVNQDPKTEFSYAINNAKKQLSAEIQAQIDKELFTIDDKRQVEFIEPEIEESFQYAYNIFQFVRNEKKLGTAVLIAMFQTMIVRFLMNKNTSNSSKTLEAIDFAFASNLIPQLWDGNTTFLETLKALCCENIGLFFTKKFKEIQDAQTMAFPKYAKQLEYFLNWYKSMIKNENYFSMNSDKDSTGFSQKFMTLTTNFKSGKSFNEESTIASFTRIIQSQGKKDLPMFESALDDEIRKSSFD